MCEMKFCLFDNFLRMWPSTIEQVDPNSDVWTQGRDEEVKQLLLVVVEGVVAAF